MEDLVGSGDCRDGNPIRRFVRSFASEKSDIQQDAMLRTSEQFQEEPQLFGDLHHPPPELQHMGPPPPELAGFLEPHHADPFEPLGIMHPDFEKGLVYTLPAEELCLTAPAWAEELEHEQRMHGDVLQLPPRAGVLRGPPLPPAHEQWVAEFRGREAPPPPWVQDFRAHMAEREHEEMVREYQEMIREEEARAFDQLERAYRDATDGPEVKQWVEEFEKMKGGSELVEDEEEEQWYNEFRQKEQLRKEQAREALSELSRKVAAITDPRLRRSNFMKFLGKLGSGELVVEGDRVVEGPARPTESWVSEFRQQEAPDDWAREFDAMHAPRPPPTWAEEFARAERTLSTSRAPHEDWAEEFERQEAEAWVEEFRRLDPTVGPGDWVRRFQELNIDGSLRDYEAAWQSGANLDTYTPAEQNPYASHPNPFQRAQELIQNGQLTEAILALEAEVARNPDNAQAWRLLGQTHAQSDKDDRAIAALRKALSITPNDLEALMSLAVSYTNEMYREEALTVLERWIQSNPRYKGIRLDMPTVMDEWGNEWDPDGVPVDKQEKVTELFIKAAQLSPHDPDPDVQIALGLLFNLSFEYDKAIECFGLALEKRPDDYLLWNKLGATLANNNRSEEAVPVYLKALHYNPNFVRARANLGISFLALKQYEQAAKYFLGALKLQPSASHIWTNLRTVFTAMERPDLLQKSMKEDVSLFAEEFDF